MKELIWKELKQYRWTPVGLSTLLAAALIAVHGLFRPATWSPSDYNAIQSSDPIGTLHALHTLTVVGLILAAIYPASSLIASEVGTGTLTFLAAMPINRSQLWLAKLIAGLMVMATSFLALNIVQFVLLLMWYGPILPYDTHGSTNSESLLLVTLFSFSAALFFSTMVDRPITAAFLAFIAGGAQTVVGLMLGVAPWFAGAPNDHSSSLGAAAAIAYGVAIPALLHASYTSFIKGGSMRTMQHIGVGAAIVACWAIVGGVAFGVGTHVADAREAAHLRAMESVVHGTPDVVFSYRPEISPVTLHELPWLTVECNLGAVTLDHTYVIRAPLKPGPTGDRSLAGDVFVRTGQTLSGVIRRTPAGAFVDLTYQPNGDEGDDNVFAAIVKDADLQTVGVVSVHAVKYAYKPGR